MDSSVVDPVNNPDTWCAFIKDRCDASETNETTETTATDFAIVHTPTSIIDEALSVPCIPQLQDKYTERVDKVDSMVRALMTKTSQTRSRRSMKLEDIRWDWMSCFGKDNYYAFDSGDITLISGKNAIGKSSFLEIICFSLFGRGFPSRTTRGMSGKIINEMRPEKDVASTEVRFVVDDNTMSLTRKMTPGSKDPNKIKWVSVQLKNLDTGSVLRKGPSDVDRWMEENIGTIDSFLSSSILTQDLDSNFFQMDSGKQKDLIDGSMNLEGASQFSSVLRETKNMYTYMLDMASTYISGMNVLDPDENVDQLESSLELMTTRLGDLADRESVLLQKWSGFKDVKYLKMDYGDLETLMDSMSERVTHIDPDTIYSQLESVTREHMVLTDRISRFIKLPRWVVPTSAVPRVDKPASLDWSDMDPCTLEEYEQIMRDAEISLAKIEDRRPVPVEVPTDDMDTVRETLDKQESIESFYDIPLVSEYMDDIGAESLKRNGILRLRKHLVARRDELKDIMTCVSEPDMSMAEVRIIQQEVDRLSDYRDYEGMSRRMETIKNLLHQSELTKSHELLKSVVDLPDVKYNIGCSCCRERRKYDETIKQNVGDVIESVNLTEDEETELKKELTALETSIVFAAEYNELRPREQEMLSAVEKWTKYNNHMKKRDTLSCEVATYDHAIDELDVFSEHSALLDSALETKRRWDLYRQYSVKTSQHKRDVARAKEHLDVTRFNFARVSWLSYLAHEKMTLELELKATTQQLDELKTNYQLLDEFKLVEDAMKTKSVYDEWLSVKSDTEKARTEMAKMTASVEIMKSKVSKEDYDLAVAFRGHMQSCLAKITRIEKAFSGDDSFKAWVYRERVIPTLEKTVNMYLTHVSGLENHTFHIEYDGKAFTYFLRSLYGSVPVEKCSGFQKFMIGLCLRLSLCKMGAFGIIGDRLIIDEGFVACDADNIQGIPELLRILLDYGDFSGIVLISHLERIQDISTNVITIETVMGFSRIHTK